MARKRKKRTLLQNLMLCIFYIWFFCFFGVLFTQAVFKSLQSIFLFFLFIILPTFIIILFVYSGYQWYKNRFGYRKIDVNNIKWKLEESDPYDFEQIVADMFKRLGYQSVETTKKSGDIGADIIMKRKDIQYVVQVKKYAKENKIGGILI